MRDFDERALKVVMAMGTFGLLQALVLVVHLGLGKFWGYAVVYAPVSFTVAVVLTRFTFPLRGRQRVYVVFLGAVMCAAGVFTVQPFTKGVYGDVAKAFGEAEKASGMVFPLSRGLTKWAKKGGGREIWLVLFLLPAIAIDVLLLFVAVFAAFAAVAMLVWAALVVWVFGLVAMAPGLLVTYGGCRTLRTRDVSDEALAA